LFTIAPPRRSRRMQGLSPEHPDVSQPLPTSTPEGSPPQSEVPVVTSQPLHTTTPEGTPEGSPHQSEVPVVTSPHVDTSEVQDVFYTTSMGRTH
jgi:hypothetical protein